MNGTQLRVAHFNCLDCGIIAEYFYNKESHNSVEKCIRCNASADGLIMVKVEVMR